MSGNQSPIVQTWDSSLRQSLAIYLKVLLCPNSIHEHEIGARMIVGFSASDCIVPSIWSQCVCSGNNQEVRVRSRVNDGSYFLYSLFTRDDCFAFEESALFGKDLVLHVQARNAGILIRPYGTTRVNHTAVPRIGVCNH